MTRIAITQTSDAEVEAFEKENWKIEDLRHYGMLVKWESWKPDFFTFKAEDNGIVVGVVACHHIAGVVFVERLIVKSNHRGKGIGKSLMKKVEAYCRGIKAHKIYLYTGKNWESNVFYASLGFELAGQLPKHFLKKDFVVYSKFLD